jgi:uncharacterized protein involved in outer membrane biogenesis
MALDQMKLVDPNAPAGEEIASASLLAVRVEANDILHGRWRAAELRMDQPHGRVYFAKDGKSNLPLDRFESDEPKSDDPIDVPVDRLIINDGQLAYTDERNKTSFDIGFGTLPPDDDKANGGLRIEGKGRYLGAGLNFKVGSASPLAIVTGKAAVPIAIDLSASTTRITAVGTVRSLTDYEGLEAQVDARGKDLAELFPLLGLAVPNTEPYHINGHLVRDGKIFRFESFSGGIGGSDISGTLQADVSGKVPKLTGEIASRKLDIKDIGPIIGLPPEAEKVQAPAADKNRRVLPDAKLDIERVRSLNADIRYKAASIDAPGVLLDNVDLHFILQDAVLRFEPLVVGVAGGIANMTARIDGNKSPVQTDLDLKLSKFQLQRFLASAGFPKAGNARIDGRIKLAMRGDSIREGLAVADGQILALMGPGEISTLGMELTGLDLTEALGFLVEGDKRSKIACFIADFDVKNGVMNTRSFAFDSSDTSILGGGQIILKDERMNLRLEAHPKDFSPATLRSPVLIRGTFASPAIGVEPGNLIARGAGAVALGVLLTPIASILAFIDPGDEIKVDCKPGGQGSVGKAPDGAAPPAAARPSRSSAPARQPERNTGTTPDSPRGTVPSAR